MNQDNSNDQMSEDYQKIEKAENLLMQISSIYYEYKAKGGHEPERYNLSIEEYQKWIKGQMNEKELMDFKNQIFDSSNSIIDFLNFLDSDKMKAMKTQNIEPVELNLHYRGALIRHFFVSYDNPVTIPALEPNKCYEIRTQNNLLIWKDTPTAEYAPQILDIAASDLFPSKKLPLERKDPLIDLVYIRFLEGEGIIIEFNKEKTGSISLTISIY